MDFYINFATISILVLVLVGQILRRRNLWVFKSGDDLVVGSNFSKMLRWFWIVSVLAILSIQTYWSAMLYRAWKLDPLAQFYLPPHQDISYFLGYVGVRFFGPWVVAFLASVVLRWLSKYFNKKFGERFFEREEIELIALGTFLTGYPGFLFYFSLLLGGYLLLQILNNVRTVFIRRRLDNASKEPRTDAENDADQRGRNLRESPFSQRLPMYYLWMPFAISAIIIKIKFLPLLGLTGFWGQFSLGDFYKLFTNY